VGAERVFREELARRANAPRALFGLAESLRARGRQFDADEMRRQFQGGWAGGELRVDEF